MNNYWISGVHEKNALTDLNTDKLLFWWWKLKKKNTMPRSLP